MAVALWRRLLFSGGCSFYLWLHLSLLAQVSAHRHGNEWVIGAVTISIPVKSGCYFLFCHISALREVETVFSPVSLLLLLRSTAPPRWRVSSVGERGALIKANCTVYSVELHCIERK